MDRRNAGALPHRKPNRTDRPKKAKPLHRRDRRHIRAFAPKSEDRSQSLHPSSGTPVRRVQATHRGRIQRPAREHRAEPSAAPHERRPVKRFAAAHHAAGHQTAHNLRCRHVAAGPRYRRIALRHLLPARLSEGSEYLLVREIAIRMQHTKSPERSKYAEAFRGSVGTAEVVCSSLALHRAGVCLPQWMRPYFPRDLCSGVLPHLLQFVQTHVVDAAVGGFPIQRLQQAKR